MRRAWPWLAVVVVVLLVVATLGAGPGAQPSRSPGGPGAGGAGSPLVSAVGQTSSAGPGGSAPTAQWSPSPFPASLASPGAPEPLSVLLAMLRVAPEDRTGYSRSLFVHWIDADGNGCDTRREVLIAEAVVKPTIGPSCWLTGGRWLSAYDGLTVTDPSKLQIDHVVALAEAWDSGASTWTAAWREAFANDLEAGFALIAVSAASNQAKSDKDPADWLPPAAGDECPFLGAWIATKVRWDLAVDPRERDVLARDLRDCPTTTMPYLPAGPDGEAGGMSPTPDPGTPGTGGVPGNGGACDPAYPTVCIPPPPPDLDCADVPYRNFQVLAPDPHRFDRDGDGIGCET